MAESENGLNQCDELRFRIAPQCIAKVSFFGAEPTQAAVKNLIDALNVVVKGYPPDMLPGREPFEAHRI